MRSITSEIDYASKKKFVDMLPKNPKKPSIDSQKRTLDADFDKKSSNRSVAASVRSAAQSVVSARSGKGLNRTLNPEDIRRDIEPINETGEEILEDRELNFDAGCTYCGMSLTEDEQRFNEQYYTQSLNKGKPVGVLPLCLKCHFE